MLKINKLLFGTAGIPLSTQKPSTENGIIKVRELNLDAMELEFVRGVNLSEDKAKEIKKLSIKENVILTAHAPYYINLNSKEPQKVYASINRILQSAKILSIANGYSVVFHPAYYSNMDKKTTYNNVKKALEKIIQKVKENKWNVWIRPETMGKHTQFGTLEEIINLSKEFEGYVLPCIDVAHIHARGYGKLKKYEDFASLFEYMEKELGKESLENCHIHFSGIEYNSKGEIRHKVLEDSDFNYVAFAEVLKNFDIKGVIISESPNIEKDALLLKNIYEELGG